MDKLKLNEHENGLLVPQHIIDNSTRNFKWDDTFIFDRENNMREKEILEIIHISYLIIPLINTKTLSF